MVDLSRQVRGSLPNTNLAPLTMAYDALFDGELTLNHGGTGSDLSGGGPGALFQAASGADVTSGNLPFNLIDYTGVVAGQVMVSTVNDTMAPGAVDLASAAPSVTGILGAGNGGTGVSNSKTLAVTTNNGTLAFLSASLTLNFDQGTDTPTYLGATTAGATTYTTQDGFWRKIGNIVFFNGRVIWTAASGTGAAIVSLPATSENTAGKRYTVVISPVNVTFANGAVVANIAPNVAFFSMNSPATNAGGTAIAVEAAGDILFAGWFCV